uniref:Uncharacterized protein n=1 Tax=Solanum tuberosum TaxID=4113 RepID=M1DYK0_SOLTU
MNSFFSKTSSAHNLSLWFCRQGFKWVFIVVKKSVAKSHSAQLVGIADALGDPPFGLLHHLSALAFNMFAFWIIGQYSTTSQNCSATHRLLHFISNLIFPFRAQHTGTKGETVGLSATRLMD